MKKHTKKVRKTILTERDKKILMVINNFRFPDEYSMAKDTLFFRVVEVMLYN